MIEDITSRVPMRWNTVNTSPSIKLANKEVTIGVGDIMIVALDTSKYERVLYQQNKPDPYTIPIAIKKKILIGSLKTLKFSTGKKIR